MGWRLVVAATALTVVGASAACGDGTVEPARPAESSGTPHSTHGEFSPPAARTPTGW